MTNTSARSGKELTMLSQYPRIDLLLTDIVDGDEVSFLIASVAGVLSADRAVVFDALLANLAGRGQATAEQCLSLHVSETVGAAPCTPIAAADYLAEQAMPYLDGRIERAA